MLRKLNEKYSKPKNFGWFRAFALHFESAESTESWENFVLLPYKWLDFLLMKLKLVFNLQNQQKVESVQLYTWKITTGVTWYKNWYRLINSCCIASQTVIISYLSTFKTWTKKNEKSSKLKHFCRFRGFALYYKAAKSP